MEKEFEAYWKTHQQHLIAKAPREMRERLVEASKLSSPLDWLLFVLPVACGIILQAYIPVRSAILSWALVAVVVVVLFVLMQMLRDRFSTKKTPEQIVTEIKRYYYDRYKRGELLIGNHN